MNQSTSNAPEPSLRIGYSRIDVTPDYPMYIAGSAARPISQGVLDPLYVTFIAIKEGEYTFLIATMDFVCSYEEFAGPMRARVSQATGIPEELVILNATHTHSSLNARANDGLNVAQYRSQLYDWAEEGAKEALEDLTPVNEILYGSIRAEKMFWVRHYKMADGSFAGANYGTFQSGIVGHASEADPEMQLIRFTRKEGKKDVILMNCPAHATVNREKSLSADFPGPAREYVAEKTDALVAYFIAGGGDQVPVSRVVEEQFSTDYRVYGKEIGRIAVEGLKKMNSQKPNKLSYLRRTFVGKSNKTDLDRKDAALAVSKIWSEVGGRSTAEAKAAAKSHGFSSVYEVTAILNRMHFSDTRSIELKTLAIGDVSIIFAPYEMFGASAMAIKENSPYPMTFIVSCSQNHVGYLPSLLGWQLRCYEAQITRFEKGTAEKLAEEYVDILREMKSSRS